MSSQYILFSESERRCHIVLTVSQVMVASLPTAVLQSHLILMLQAVVLAIVQETNHRSKVSKQKRKVKKRDIISNNTFIIYNIMCVMSLNSINFFFFSTEIAPMMAKTIKAFKNRFSRR